MSYAAIGFDYGGVLAGRSGYSFALDVARLFEIDFETYQRTYTEFKRAVNRGELSWEALWERFAGKVGKPGKLQAVMELDKQYVQDLKRVNPEMLKLVDDLRAQGFKLGLLSNNTLENAKRFRQEHLAEHFDVVHVSAETGLVKPERDAFRHFAADLGVGLKELIYIDDSEISLSTAPELGYTPLLFQGYDELTKQLSDLGVIV